jgi:hypothetical protein
VIDIGESPSIWESNIDHAQVKGFPAIIIIIQYTISFTPMIKS